MSGLRILVVVALGLCLGGCANMMIRAHPNNGNGHIKIIAHRGASGHAPENTLAAFRLATKSKADYFELDCRLTKDDAVVISHDADLERTTGHKVNIADLSLSEVQSFDAGSWFDPRFSSERIPTLAQALDVATPECGVYVEIKAEAGDGAPSEAMVAQVQDQKQLTKELQQQLQEVLAKFDTRSVPLTWACITEIRAKHMEKRVVIQSFSPLICFIACTEAPEIRTELLLSDDKNDSTHFDRYADFGLLIGVKGINVAKDSLTPERLKAIHKAHATVAVYTLADDWDELHRFANMEVDSIITNWPEECYDKVKTIK